MVSELMADQRMTVIAPGQIPPNQDHGSARSDAEKDAAGQGTPPQGNLQRFHYLQEKIPKM